MMCLHIPGDNLLVVLLYIKSTSSYLSSFDRTCRKWDCLRHCSTHQSGAAVVPRYLERHCGYGLFSLYPSRACQRVGCLRASHILSKTFLEGFAGGALFALLDEVPAINKAGWRLWWTAAIQLVPFLGSVLAYSGVRIGWGRVDKYFANLRSKTGRGGMAVFWPRWVRSMPLLAATGIILAFHFAAWSWSVEHTTLTRSLLFVTAHPVVGLAFVGLGGLLTSCLLHPACLPPHSQQENADQRQPDATLCTRVRATCLRLLPNRSLTWLELGGTGIALAGAVLMVLPEELGWGGSTAPVAIGPQPSLAGDAAALLGAVAMAAYLWVGASLRRWTPLWLYAFPVTLIAALSASLASWALEDEVSPLASGASGWFGWANQPHFALLAFLSGFISGILGHSLAILSLKYLSPLVVSVALLLEPLLGSFIGWATQQQGVPTLWTGLGGFVLLIGIVLVTLAQKQDKQTDMNSEVHAKVPRFSAKKCDLAKGAFRTRPALLLSALPKASANAERATIFGVI